MEDGEISGNTAKGSGGGVNIGENGTFTMKGGAISGNTITNNSGGGVNIGKNGTFTMEGGTISGNTATYSGGGVLVGENGTFTMEDGTIGGNTAPKGNGGGVFIYKGTFTMKGGEINDNTANGGVQSGGGVGVAENGTFTMEGGTISGNTAGGAGGGVFVNGGALVFTKKGGTIYGDTDRNHTPGSTENTALKEGGHAVHIRNDKIRSADAGPEIKLYAKKENGVWIYNDSASGGVGDTTTNWEESGPPVQSPG
jgi:hypothetical protein